MTTIIYHSSFIINSRYTSLLSNYLLAFNSLVILTLAFIFRSHLYAKKQRKMTRLLLLVFGRNITLRYDTGIIRVFYAHVIFNFSPPILRPQFYGSPKYDPKPGQ